MKFLRLMPSVLKRRILVFHLAALGALGALGACGAVVDYARDNEMRWGPLGGHSFVSPLKLRVGVAPFRDEVGLGASGAGTNLARLLSEELARDSRLTLIPVEETAAALNALAADGPLTPAQAAQAGADLRLNALITGSLSEINSYSRRKGWRRIARIVVSQREYVDAVLAVSAVDAATGIVLLSRATVGEYDGGPGEKRVFEDERQVEGPGQEAMEGSLDAALADSAYRALAGLAALPFKARVISVDGGRALIAFGADVGLKKGQKFVRLEPLRTVVNVIGEAYQVMGAAEARLTALEVGETSAVLEIAEGGVQPGDIVQALN